jgi:hypothetical protein
MPHQSVAQSFPDGEHDGGLLTVADLDRKRIHRKPVLGVLITITHAPPDLPKNRRSRYGSYFRAGQVRGPFPGH